MSELNQRIVERVEEVVEDLSLQTGYDLSTKQQDELRLTGRVGIDVREFAPYLTKTEAYLAACDDEDVVWKLSLNTISGDFEIELKGCHLNF